MSSTRRGFLGTVGSAASAASIAQGSSEMDDQQPDHQHQTVPSDMTLRVKALESLLVEKGLVDPAALDALVDTYEHKVSPRNGARVVARAGGGPAYQQRLLESGTAALGELGYSG